MFSDVAGMVTLTTNAETILQRATHNLLLAGDTALAPELEQVASHLHSNGRIALVEAEARVQKISPSLSLLFFIVRRLQESAGAQGRELVAEAVERLATRGHEDRLERVLGHFVQNAFDATPGGGRVWISVQRYSGQVKVEVGDKVKEGEPVATLSAARDRSRCLAGIKAGVIRQLYGLVLAAGT